MTLQDAERLREQLAELRAKHDKLALRLADLMKERQQLILKLKPLEVQVQGLAASLHREEQDNAVSSGRSE